jgi:phage terminase Nu1 subunit (DNA packaging protein)
MGHEKSVKEIAGAMGVAPRTVRDWAAQGCNLAWSIDRIRKWRDEHLRPDPRRSRSTPMMKRKLRSQVRMAESKAVEAEAKLASLSADLVPTAAVLETIAARNAWLKDVLLSVPDTVKATFPAEARANLIDRARDLVGMIVKRLDETNHF